MVKLTACEAKALVRLEAKQIKDKEARAKKRAENREKRQGARAIPGSQVLPSMAGITANVPTTQLQPQVLQAQGIDPLQQSLLAAGTGFAQILLQHQLMHRGVWNQEARERFRRADIAPQTDQAERVNVPESSVVSTAVATTGVRSSTPSTAATTIVQPKNLLSAFERNTTTTNSKQPAEQPSSAQSAIQPKNLLSSFFSLLTKPAEQPQSTPTSSFSVIPMSEEEKNEVELEREALQKKMGLAFEEEMRDAVRFGLDFPGFLRKNYPENVKEYEAGKLTGNRSRTDPWENMYNKVRREHVLMRLNDTDLAVPDDVKKRFDYEKNIPDTRRLFKHNGEEVVLYTDKYGEHHFITQSGKVITEKANPDAAGYRESFDKRYSVDDAKENEYNVNAQEPPSYIKSIKNIGVLKRAFDSADPRRLALRRLQQNVRQASQDAMYRAFHGLDTEGQQAFRENNDIEDDARWTKGYTDWKVRNKIGRDFETDELDFDSEEMYDKFEQEVAPHMIGRRLKPVPSLDFDDEQLPMLAKEFRKKLPTGQNDETLDMLLGQNMEAPANMDDIFNEFMKGIPTGSKTRNASTPSTPSTPLVPKKMSFTPLNTFDEEDRQFANRALQLEQERLRDMKVAKGLGIPGFTENINRMENNPRFTMSMTSPLPMASIELQNMPSGVSSSGYVQYNYMPNPNFAGNETQPSSNRSSFEIEDTPTDTKQYTEGAGYDFEGDFSVGFENENVLSQYNNTGNIGSNTMD